MPIFSIHPDFRLNGQSFKNCHELLHYTDRNLPSHYAFLKDWCNDDDSVIVHTSGSTGLPKNIRVVKQHMINSAQNTIRFFQLYPGSKVLLNLSANFIAGKMMWVRALTGGWDLDVIPPENKFIAQKLANSSYDFGAMVPLQVYQNLNAVHKIKKLIIGGGAISPELEQKLWRLPNEIYATYGMTETLTHIAVKPVNEKAMQNFYQHNERIDSYRIFPGIHIKTDRRGCLVIDAPQLNNEKVITNDLVEIIDAKHFRWLGRYDNIINTGGVKLIPEQIEQKIKLLIAKPFFIGALPDDKLGQKVVLFIEGLIDKDILKNNISQILSGYEIPKEIFCLDTFVRTDTGKIKRFAVIHNFYSYKYKL